MPIPQFTLAVSGRIEDLPDRAHNLAAKGTGSPKGAMVVVLQEHHQRRIPGHFKQYARAKYRHKARSPIYKAFKRKKFHSITDLVRTGKTERMATGMARIRIGGTFGTFNKSAATVGIVGHLVMPVGFKMRWRDSSNPRAVRTEDMAREITAINPDEAAEMASTFQRVYTHNLNYYSTNRRSRIYGKK